MFSLNLEWLAGLVNYKQQQQIKNPQKPHTTGSAMSAVPRKHQQLGRFPNARTNHPAAILTRFRDGTCKHHPAWPVAESTIVRPRSHTSLILSHLMSWCEWAYIHWASAQLRWNDYNLCFVLLFYPIATVFQLYLGGDMIHEMRRRSWSYTFTNSRDL